MKKILYCIMSIYLVFATTTAAYAASSVGGWSALDVITAGATNTINATKTAGGKVLNSAVTIAPQAGKVGKHLIKGGGAAALAFAMVELADGALDWVLDPANNRVKVTYPSGDTANPDGRCYAIPGMPAASSPAAACAAWYQPSWDVKRVVAGGASCQGGYSWAGGLNSVAVTRVTCPAGMTPEPAAPVEKYIPIDTVAAKVISNAEAGHAPSQEAVKATALEGFAAGEHDAALDAAATEAGTENPPDTENPPKDPDAPAEPFDPAGIISAINALKALLAGILSSITSLSDFFQSEPPPEPKPEDTELDIPVPDVVPVDTDINFGGSCPANFEFNGSIFGNSINIVLLDTSKFCGFLSTFVKFPVYAASSLFALYILGGRKDV